MWKRAWGSLVLAHTNEVALAPVEIPLVLRKI